MILPVLLAGGRLFACWLGVVNRSSVFLFGFPGFHPCGYFFFFVLALRVIYRRINLSISRVPLFPVCAAWNFAIGANQLSGIINVSSVSFQCGFIAVFLDAALY